MMDRANRHTHILGDIQKLIQRMRAGKRKRERERERERDEVTHHNTHCTSSRTVFHIRFSIVIGQLQCIELHLKKERWSKAETEAGEKSRGTWTSAIKCTHTQCQELPSITCVPYTLQRGGKVLHTTSHHTHEVGGYIT